MNLVLAFCAVGAACFAIGVAVAIAILSVEDDTLPYDKAKKTWRRMEGL